MTNPFVFTQPTDKMPGAWHGAYLGVYARLFEPIRKTKHSIGEIGVDGAGSLLMYSAYFESSNPVGMDIQPKPSSLDGSDRITYYQADAYSVEGYAKFHAHAPFALIVDDGNHMVSSQRIFCRSYPRLLTEDGMCIVEDVQGLDDIVQLAKEVPEGFYSFAVDLRHHGRYDNILFCITRN